jgi:hypothetical protein
MQYANATCVGDWHCSKSNRSTVDTLQTSFAMRFCNATQPNASPFLLTRSRARLSLIFNLPPVPLIIQLHASSSSALLHSLSSLRCSSTPSIPPSPSTVTPPTRRTTPSKMTTSMGTPLTMGATTAMTTDDQFSDDTFD